ncbi:MAG: cytochrome c biogenesis protein CcsA [Acidobacteria bacterium]|nr:cytochrome c biogenesis protein CcsA [Acidobacteriota bacterium]
MTLIWLRVALFCYAVGLLYALVALNRTAETLSKVALHAAYLGMVLHFVSLVEAVVDAGQFTLASVHNSESLLAFLIMVVFMIAYLIYKTTSPGIVVFPIVFLLTFVAATAQQPLVLTPVAVKGWLAAHILMIFTGYAALFLSFGASLLYLLQERALKAKNSVGVFARLPALQVIDDIGYRSLMLGFPFMTLGLVLGSVVAESAYGKVDFFDPKILLSVLMWVVYLLMVYMRLSAGWRGRRAALLASVAFVAAIVAWAANYFSGMHRFIAS